jgi:hypothetical protein
VEGCDLSVAEGPLRFHDFPTGEDGTTRIGPLDPGRDYYLECTPARRAKPGLARAWINHWRPRDTTLRLDAWEPQPVADEADHAPEPGFDGAAVLRLHVANWPCAEESVVVEEAEIVSERGGRQKVGFCPPNIEIGGLRKDERYTFRIVGVGDGLAAEVPGLTPREQPYEIALAPGQTIRGRIDLPPNADYASVRAFQGHLRACFGSEIVVYADGRFEIPGVLPGRWRLDVSVSAGEDWYGVEAEVAPGEEARLVPHPLGD